MSLVFERRVVSRKLLFAESLLVLAGSYLHVSFGGVSPNAFDSLPPLLCSTPQEGLHGAWLGYAFHFEDFDDR
jgi:hypothetical protein